MITSDSQTIIELALQSDLFVINRLSSNLKIGTSSSECAGTDQMKTIIAILAVAFLAASLQQLLAQRRHLHLGIMRREFTEPRFSRLAT